MSARLDPLPDARGVVYPDRTNPIVPDDATCQETLTMIGNRYVRCGAPATCVIDNKDRNAYWMCQPCGWHNVRNRGGKLLAGSIGAEAREKVR